MWTIGCAAGNGDARPGRAPGDGPGTRTGRTGHYPSSSPVRVTQEQALSKRAQRAQPGYARQRVGGGDDNRVLEQTLGRSKPADNGRALGGWLETAVPKSRPLAHARRATGLCPAQGGRVGERRSVHWVSVFRRGGRDSRQFVGRLCRFSLIPSGLWGRIPSSGSMSVIRPCYLTAGGGQRSALSPFLGLSRPKE